jgi:sphingolipid delta-4 desaturase
MKVLVVAHNGSDRSHLLRRRLILEKHPEVRSLFGVDRLTFFVTAGLLLAQMTIAAYLGQLGVEHWPLAVLLAICVGAFANHANHVVIHDAIHNLVFKRRVLNRLTAILADLPNCIPTAMSFRCYHLKHHAQLSAYDHDADIPSDWEVRLVGNSSWRKAAWLFFFPIAQLSRLSRLQEPLPLWTPWTYFNIAAVIVFDVFVLFVLGGNALVYLLASFWFSVGGLHPLSARWLQEHFSFGPDQGTFGYYGPLNRVALNIGYHNEHHDFQEIPWRLLPQLKAMAPEFYDTLGCHDSWIRLLATFISDPAYSLQTRSTNVARSAPRDFANWRSGSI